MTRFGPLIRVHALFYESIFGISMKQDYKPSPRQNTRQKIQKVHPNLTSSAQPASSLINKIKKKQFVLISLIILITAIVFSLVFTFEKHHQTQLAQRSSQPVQITLAIPTANNTSA